MLTKTNQLLYSANQKRINFLYIKNNIISLRCLKKMTGISLRVKNILMCLYRTHVCLSVRAFLVFLSVLLICCSQPVWLTSIIFFSPVPDRPPLYITYTSPTSTTILLHWSSVLAQFANGIISGFRVEYQDIGLSNSTVKTRERFLVNWVLLDGLKKFTEYSVRVCAFTSVGYGPENILTVLTSQDGKKT